MREILKSLLLSYAMIKAARRKQDIIKKQPTNPWLKKTTTITEEHTKDGKKN